jgi:hypothetical protein
MQGIERRLVCLAALAAATLTACATDFTASELNVTEKAAKALRPEGMAFHGVRDDLTLRPVVAQDLVGAEGQCAAGTAGPSMVPVEGAPAVGGGIALQMTECEVVARAGAPDRVEFGTERSERAVVLTYGRGPRPGVYRFAGGRLYSIERGPEPPPAAPKQKKAPAKKRPPA